MSEPSDTEQTVPGQPERGTEPAWHDTEAHPQASAPATTETPAEQAAAIAENASDTPQPPAPPRAEERIGTGSTDALGEPARAGEAETSTPTAGPGVRVEALEQGAGTAYGEIHAPAPHLDTYREGQEARERKLLPRLASGSLVIALSAAAGFAGGTLAGERGEGGNPSASTVTVVQHSSPVSSGVDWVAEVASKVQPSVVGIQVMADNGQTGSGSGVAFTPDGYILTNAHVVDQASRISVRLNQGESITAELIGTDPLYDIAVIRIPNDIPAAVFNTQAAAVGEPVAAFGSPLGLYGTVTVGIVSAVARPVTAGNGQGETSIISAVQTDAAINPGNSGGPLVNAGGEVIGVNSSIATLSGDRGGSIGLGFAIPAKTAVRVATELINTGTASRPLIGVTVGPADGSGARVETVSTGSPAEQAGIEAGDVLIAVDGRPVDNPVAAIALIRDATPGQPLTITLDRAGYEMTVTVTTTSDAPQVVSVSPPVSSSPTAVPAPSVTSIPPVPGAPSAPSAPLPSASSSAVAPAPMP